MILASLFACHLSNKKNDDVERGTCEQRSPVRRRSDSKKREKKGKEGDDDDDDDDDGKE